MLQAESRPPFQYKSFLHLSRSRRPQDRNHAGGARSPKILGQPERVSLHLPLPSLSANLLDNIADLPRAGSAHGMPFGFQTAARVHRPLAINARAPGQTIRAA